MQAGQGVALLRPQLHLSTLVTLRLDFAAPLPDNGGRFS